MVVARVATAIFPPTTLEADQLVRHSVVAISFVAFIQNDLDETKKEKIEGWGDGEEEKEKKDEVEKSRDRCYFSSPAVYIFFFLMVLFYERSSLLTQTINL